MPQGWLKQGGGGKSVYENRTHSLPPNGERALAIVRRNMLEAKARTIEANLQAQETVAEKYKSYRDDKVLGRMRPVYQKIIETAWKKEAQNRQAARIAAQQEAIACGTAYHPENLKQKNARGEINRSKSEIIVDNCYSALGISVSYEERIYWPDDAPDFAWELKCRLNIPDYYVPDFTVTLPDGTKKYHEHLGLMKSGKYMENWMKKMILYYWAGVIPGKNLIITADDRYGGIDQQEIMALLQYCFAELIGTAL